MDVEGKVTVHCGRKNNLSCMMIDLEKFVEIFTMVIYYSMLDIIIIMLSVCKCLTAEIL